MSFLSDASLVMIPSGYKDQKVYSSTPTDGSADLTFSRASNATRVNSSGLVEKVRTNLALQSQSFATSAVWGTVNGTVTNNAGTAPDGTNTASKIVATDADPFVYQPLTLSGSVVVSCYVKGIGSSIGKNGSIRAGSSLTVFTITGDWQRVSLVHSAGGAQNYGLETPESAAVSDEVLLWGFQVEQGDIATDYIATTSAAVSVGPVSGLPRLDYSGGASCPSLLLEPQRTNVLLSSEDWTTNWSGANRLVTANDIVSPDGYQNADKLSAVGGGSYYSQVRTSASGGNTFSVFLKYGNKTTQSIYAYSSGSYFGRANFNLQTGTVSSTSSGTASIEDYGGGWYRCSVSGSAISSTIEIGIEGIGTSDHTYAWGAQLEAGAYATSYIPTLSSAVTRVADAASKTGASALIGQTEGTIFWEIDLRIKSATGSDDLLNLDAGSFGDTIYFYKVPDGRIVADIFVSGVAQASFILAAASVNVGIVKMALGYANNNAAFFVNGVQVGTTDTSCSIPAMSRIQLGNTAVGPSFSQTKQVLLFTQRLSNSDLATLTA